MHAFQFAATMPAPSAPLDEWHAQLRRLEDLGLSSVVAANCLIVLEEVRADVRPGDSVLVEPFWRP